MDYTDFTDLYPLPKTLRFELKPIGKTLKNILNDNLLDEDAHRAKSYVEVKKIIDKYHKAFIDNVLETFKLKYDTNSNKDSLEDFYSWYIINNNDKRNETLKIIQANLRKQIAEALTKEDVYKRIFKKELIKEDLIQFIQNDDEKELIEEFKDFTTYFTGFNENRKNMYSCEDKSTAIAYRLINDNLPKFVDNMNAFLTIVSIPEMKANLDELYHNMEEYLNVTDICEMFSLDYYNMVLTQKQISVYNAIIGGKPDGETKIKGINEYVNLYNQQHKETRLPKLKVLFKQILSDRITISWLPEEFKDDNETLKAISECYKDLSKDVFSDEALKSLLCSIAALSQEELNGIYITNDLQLTDISNKVFGSWSVIEDSIVEDIKNRTNQKKKETNEDYADRVHKLYKKIPSFSIGYIDQCVSQLGINKRIEHYFASMGAINTPSLQLENIFARISNSYTDVTAILTCDYPENKNLSQDKESVEKIKNLLDNMKNLQRFIKPLLGNGEESDKNDKFYGELLPLCDELNIITPLYNKVRNWVTRKPYSQNKIKLNFQNSQLLGGWDQNKEKDYNNVILRKNGLYYLGIMKKSQNKIFEEKNITFEGDCYEKMVYKLIPGASKSLPHVFLSKKGIKTYKPSENILKRYNEKTHKSGDNFSIDDCHALIDYYKISISKHPDWKNFGFVFSETSSYNNLNDFYKELDPQAYNISFRKVSASYINSLVEEGKLYLFQIYNKDFSPYSKGTPNMHTLYWKMLFDERNLANVVYKLNGNAEVFYRKHSLNVSRPTHPASIPILNKNKENCKKESLFDYDLIKDRRYTVDKFQLYVPITMNFKSSGRDNINDIVRDYLQSSDDTHVIGIDRGERHLLYLTVIDKHGNIKEQFTLNEIVNEYNGNRYCTNYHDLLDTREGDRLKARQSWQTIENIKELKEGYLSQVVNKIYTLMLTYHAIVVLEDLNFGFMRSRQKVEKQVYQKFEKMLINKLNYLVVKNEAPEKPCGLLNALQLTSKFDSFQKLGKQSGFLFYIPAWNTSKIDPVTGFVNLLDTRYENTDKSKSFFSKFDSIRYNKDKNWFEFALDYTKFGTKADGTQTKWTLCTYGNRIKTFRNKEKNSEWDSKVVNLTQAFKEFFNSFNIDYKNNLKESIANQNGKIFFESLYDLLKLTLQMRNSITGSTVDYLQSPVAGENDMFYNSDECSDCLPKNADANGAYNIARKGLMLIDQLKKAEDTKNIKFDISNKSWLNFAQQKPYLDE